MERTGGGTVDDTAGRENLTNSKSLNARKASHSSKIGLEFRATGLHGGGESQ